MRFVSYKLCEHVLCVMQKGSVAVLYLQFIIVVVKDCCYNLVHPNVLK